jgi:hypothetical protein
MDIAPFRNRKFVELTLCNKVKHDSSPFPLHNFPTHKIKYSLIQEIINPAEQKPILKGTGFFSQLLLEPAILEMVAGATGPDHCEEDLRTVR